MQNTDNHLFQNMFFLVMPDLMGQNRHQFTHRMPGNQGIEQGDTPVFAKSCKKGIALADLLLARDRGRSYNFV